MKALRKSAGEHLDDALARYARGLRELEVPEFQPVFDWLLEQRRASATAFEHGASGRVFDRDPS